MAFPVVGGLRALEFRPPGEMRRRLVDLADFRVSHTSYWLSVGTPVGVDTLVVQLYFDLVAQEPRA